MKIKLLLSTFVFFILTGCHSIHKTSPSTMQLTQDTLTYNMENKDIPNGLSFEKAIIINENSEVNGIVAEKKWLREHYPDSKMKFQTLLTHDKKPYDLMTMTSPEGKELKVYFDISSFFGKF